MEQAIVYLFIGLGYLVYYIVQAARKNAQNTPNSEVQTPIAPPVQETTGSFTTNQERHQNTQGEILQREAQRQLERNQQAYQRDQQREQHTQAANTSRNSGNQSTLSRSLSELLGIDPPPLPPPPIEEPAHFLDREIEHARQDHYSEEKLVREFTRTHAQGKTISHHTHSPKEEVDIHLKIKRKKSGKNRKIMAMMYDPNQVRKAYILKEILERKY